MSSPLKQNTTTIQELLNTINSLPEAIEQETPVISINSANGLITATAGTKTSTHQLAFQPAKTITPSTASQTAVSSGYYTGGNITVKGDSNLVADNIKSGVSIFGVAGSYESSGIQYEIVTIPAGSNSVAYTLPRVTHAFGSAPLLLETVNSMYGPYNNSVVSIRNNSAYYIYNLDYSTLPEWIEVEFDSSAITYSNGILTIDIQNGIMFDVQVLLVNDPTAPQISLPS